MISSAHKMLDSIYALNSSPGGGHRRHGILYALLMQPEYQMPLFPLHMLCWAILLRYRPVLDAGYPSCCVGKELNLFLFMFCVMGIGSVFLVVSY